MRKYFMSNYLISRIKYETLYYTMTIYKYKYIIERFKFKQTCKFSDDYSIEANHITLLSGWNPKLGNSGLN